VKAIALGLKERPKFKPGRDLKGSALEGLPEPHWYWGWDLLDPFFTNIPPWGKLGNPTFPTAF
jgi:hypothetical protein